MNWCIVLVRLLVNSNHCHFLAAELFIKTSGIFYFSRPSATKEDRGCEILRDSLAGSLEDSGEMEVYNLSWQGTRNHMLAPGSQDCKISLATASNINK